MMSNQWAYVPKFYRILEQERIWRSSNLIFYFTNRETETQELSPSLSLNTHTYFWVMHWVTAYRKYRSGLRKRKGKWPRARPVAPWSIQVCVAQLQSWGHTSYPCFKNHSWSQISFFFTKTWVNSQTNKGSLCDSVLTFQQCSVHGSYWGRIIMSRWHVDRAWDTILALRTPKTCPERQVFTHRGDSGDSIAKCYLVGHRFQLVSIGLGCSQCHFQCTFTLGGHEVPRRTVNTNISMSNMLTKWTSVWCL